MEHGRLGVCLECQEAARTRSRQPDKYSPSESAIADPCSAVHCSVPCPVQPACAPARLLALPACLSSTSIRCTIVPRCIGLRGLWSNRWRSLILSRSQLETQKREAAGRDVAGASKRPVVFVCPTRPAGRSETRREETERDE